MICYFGFLFFLPKGEAMSERLTAHRICIGRALAENSLLIILATMISTLRIEWPLDEEGKRTPFEPEWSFRGQAYVSLIFNTTSA